MAAPLPTEGRSGPFDQRSRFGQQHDSYLHTIAPSLSAMIPWIYERLQHDLELSWKNSLDAMAAATDALPTLQVTWPDLQQFELPSLWSSAGAAEEHVQGLLSLEHYRKAASSIFLGMRLVPPSEQGTQGTQQPNGTTDEAPSERSVAAESSELFLETVAPGLSATMSYVYSRVQADAQRFLDEGWTLVDCAPAEGAYIYGRVQEDFQRLWEEGWTLLDSGTADDGHPPQAQLNTPPETDRHTPSLLLLDTTRPAPSRNSTNCVASRDTPEVSQGVPNSPQAESSSSQAETAENAVDTGLTQDTEDSAGNSSSLGDLAGFWQETGADSDAKWCSAFLEGDLQLLQCFPEASVVMIGNDPRQSSAARAPPTPEPPVAVATGDPQGPTANSLVEQGQRAELPSSTFTAQLQDFDSTTDFRSKVVFFMLVVPSMVIVALMLKPPPPPPEKDESKIGVLQTTASSLRLVHTHTAKSKRAIVSVPQLKPKEKLKFDLKEGELADASMKAEASEFIKMSRKQQKQQMRQARAEKRTGTSLPAGPLPPPANSRSMSVDSQSSPASPRALPAIPRSLPGLSIDSVLPFKIFVLLLHPVLRTFELIHLTYDPTTTTVRGLLKMIPSQATDQDLAKQSYSGFCRPMTNEAIYKSNLLASGNDNDKATCACIARGEILAALPKGCPASQVSKASKQILKNQLVAKLFKKYDPLGIEHGVKFASTKKPAKESPLC